MAISIFSSEIEDSDFDSESNYY